MTTPPLHRRQWLQAGLAIGTTLWLPPAHACEFFSTHLRITHPWTRASAPGATTAVVCMKFDEVMQADRLIAVETPVAQAAELVTAGTGASGGERGATAIDGLNFPIPAGRETQLHEAGPHLRLLGLQFPLELAREYPLKLIFDLGGAVNATLSVDYARSR